MALVSFFPQLVAGPIERAANLLPQFYKKRSFSYVNSVEGCRQMLWGFFKKVVIADNCAAYVNVIWENYNVYSGGTLLLTAILFALQIYGDFSGYSDIAIGASKLFGFCLMRNFAFPYFSRDMAEFWRRWHISLTTWCMKNFIREIITYFIIVLFICVLMTGTTYIITSSANFEISEDKTMVFVGDSHTECAINDKIFTQAFNISQSGTSYMYSYIKLKKFLAINKNIEKVVVSFHGGSIQQSLDEWTIGEKYILAHGTDYISLMSINEFNVLMKNKIY